MAIMSQTTSISKPKSGAVIGSNPINNPNTKSNATFNPSAPLAPKAPKPQVNTGNAADSVGVRDYMNANGFDNNKIGWNGSAVTYNNQPFITPSQNNDGTTSDTRANLDAAATNYLGNQGLLPVRDTLNYRGVNNNQIGWNDKTSNITIGGKDVGSPTFNAGGTSYSSEDDINRLTDLAYQSMGNPLVAARDYASSQGLQADWDGANVLLAGQSFKPVYVKDGTAYVPRADVEKAIASFRNRSGIDGNREVYNSFVEQDNGRLEKLATDLNNRPAFSYDYRTDEGFQQHKDLLNELSDRAFNTVLARNNSDLNGASAAVLSQAMNARDDYLRHGEDDLFDYRKNALNEYESETNRRRAMLSDTTGMLDEFYNKRYNSNRDSVGDTRTNQLDNETREQQDIDNQFRDRELRNSTALNDAQIADTRANTETTNINNQQTRINNAERNASAAGYVTPELSDLNPAYNMRTGSYWKDGILYNADGTMMTPWVGEDAYKHDMTAAELRANKEFE